MLKGLSLSIYARFSDKKRTSLYISREKDDHYYIQTRHNDLFPLQSFSSKTLKTWPEKRAYILREYIGACLCPMGIPQYSLNLSNSMWLPYQKKGLLNNNMFLKGG